MMDFWMYLKDDFFYPHFHHASSPHECRTYDGEKSWWSTLLSSHLILAIFGLAYLLLPACISFENPEILKNFITSQNEVACTQVGVHFVAHHLGYLVMALIALCACRKLSEKSDF